MQDLALREPEAPANETPEIEITNKISRRAALTAEIKKIAPGISTEFSTIKELQHILNNAREGIELPPMESPAITAVTVIEPEAHTEDVAKPKRISPERLAEISQELIKNEQAIGLVFRKTLPLVIKQGALLLEVRDGLDHGEWGPWLKASGLKPRSVTNYMNVARSKSANFADLETVTLQQVLKRISKKNGAGEGQACDDAPKPNGHDAGETKPQGDPALAELGSRLRKGYATL